MSDSSFGAALVASLDEEAVRALADRLRPHLEDRPRQQPLLTPAQAAERLRLHPKTVVRMAREGRLPAVKVGTGWRLDADRLHIAPPIRPPRVEPRAARHRPCPNVEPASVAAIRGRERSAA